MKKLPVKQLLVPLLILLVFALINYYKERNSVFKQDSTSSQIEETYSKKQSDVQVQGNGQIVKLLADDLQGAKHQKFIVRINKSLTVLISHNIDLAPRINDIRAGEDISFYGEYVYNKKGGLVHWTHHDPQGRHVDGWLKYKGETYQ